VSDENSNVMDNANRKSTSDMKAIRESLQYVFNELTKTSLNYPYI